MIRSLLLRLIYSLALVAVLDGHGFAQSRQNDYVHQDSSHFRIWYCPEDSTVVRDLWHIFYVRIPLIELQLRLSLSDTVNFIITPSKAEWQRLTGGAPLWANGIANPQRAVAVLKSPRFSIQYGPLANTAVHEYVHLLTQTGAKEMDIPRWLDEGMAEVLAGQMEYMSSVQLGRAAAARRLHSFSQLQMLMAMPEQEARLGYAESAIAVELLVKKFGWPGVANLISELRQGVPFEDAFSRTFQISVGAFESGYQAHVLKTYQFSWITDTELWVSALFVIGVLAAGLAAWRRRRRILKKWEEEHRAANIGETNPPPYVINYEIIRGRKDEGGEEDKSP